MPGRIVLILFLLLCTRDLVAQEPKKDSLVVDSLFTDYDMLFSELDAFLDSLMAPRSFLVVNLAVGSSYFNFESKSDYTLTAKKKLQLAPSIAYFHKSGFGISASSNIIRNEDQSISPYQYSISGSWDYIRSKKFIGGVSFTKFFIKDDLDFYTSPLQNAAYAYFTYRKWWIRPTIAASYGWGSRTSYSERSDYITSIRLRPRGFTRINTEESVNDFSVTTSVRHDFYWLDVFGKNDFIRFTPQIIFVSGTQKFGFNQSSSSYGVLRTNGLNVLYNSENTNLDEQLYFQPVSLTGTIKAEYSTGKFYIQPQVLFDYYFPATTNNFTIAYMLNTGFMF